MARYPFPWDRFLGLALALPSGRRSLVDDCIALWDRIEPGPVLEGRENIPRSGAVVLVANHYQRRGLWIAWPGAVITAAVADRRSPEPPIHWLVTGGLRWMQWRRKGPEMPLTRWVLRTVADTYVMAALPLDGEAERAAGIRRWLRWAAAGDAVGVFPEGLAGNAGGLGWPDPGFGTLYKLVNRKGLPWLPCAIYEEGDTLHVHFGTCIHAPPDSDSNWVMERIAMLLPSHQRGVYGDPAVMTPLPAGGQR